MLLHSTYHRFIVNAKNKHTGLNIMSLVINALGGGHTQYMPTSQTRHVVRFKNLNGID